MRTRRAALLVAAALAVAALVAALLVFRSLDARIENALETIGSELLGTRVSVGSVVVDVRGGRATVRGVEVANPRGETLDFSDEPALRCGEIEIALEPASVVGSGPVVLSEVRVLAPRLSAEVTPTGINLLELERRVARASPAAADQEAAGSAEPRRFVVRRLVFEDATLRADSRPVGGDVRELPLADLVLSEIGAPRGVTPAELGQRVLEALLTRTLAELARARIGALVE
ncbi:MAG TPA: hypothetical protein VHQ66_04930, partial [Myxococcota bacterium]|nr:hypothetical protein [Myxococcota bacterium]